MTKEDVLRVVKEYKEDLVIEGAVPASMKGTDSAVKYTERAAGDYKRRLDHLRFMCEMIEILADKGEMEKVFRWLGFLQGALWMIGAYTINEMAEHNRGGSVDG